MTAQISPPGSIADIRWVEAPFIPARPDPELDRLARRKLHHPLGGMECLTHVPWVVQSNLALSAFRSRRFTFDFEGMIGLVVAQENSCRHCYGATRSLMKLLGYREDFVRRLEHDVHALPITPREKAGLDFARKLARGIPRPGVSELTTLRQAGFDAEEIADLVAGVAVGVMCSRMSTLSGMQPESGFERFANGAVVRWFGPVLGLLLRRMHMSWELPASPAAPGPAEALLGAAANPRVREICRWMAASAFASPGITPRSRALAMIIIAEVLGCRLCRGFARDLLAASGLAAAEVDSIVAHLGSPSLTPFEGKLIRFARETVRYRAETIHPRCLEMYAGLTPVETVEVIGTVALANGLARLSILSAA